MSPGAVFACGAPLSANYNPVELLALARRVVEQTSRILAGTWEAAGMVGAR